MLYTWQSVLQGLSQQSTSRIVLTDPHKVRLVSTFSMVWYWCSVSKRRANNTEVQKTDKSKNKHSPAQLFEKVLVLVKFFILPDLVLGVNVGNTLIGALSWFRRFAIRTVRSVRFRYGAHRSVFPRKRIAGRRGIGRHENDRATLNLLHYAVYSKEFWNQECSWKARQRLLQNVDTSLVIVRR
jgi:hypothetical protein